MVCSQLHNRLMHVPFLYYSVHVCLSECCAVASTIMYYNSVCDMFISVSTDSTTFLLLFFLDSKSAEMETNGLDSCVHLRICFVPSKSKVPTWTDGYTALAVTCLFSTLYFLFLRGCLCTHLYLSSSHIPGRVISSLYFKCPMATVSFNLHKRSKQVLLLFKGSN